MKRDGKRAMVKESKMNYVLIKNYCLRKLICEVFVFISFVVIFCVESASAARVTNIQSRTLRFRQFHTWLAFPSFLQVVVSNSYYGVLLAF